MNHIVAWVAASAVMLLAVWAIASLVRNQRVYRFRIAMIGRVSAIASQRIRERRDDWLEPHRWFDAGPSYEQMVWG